MKRAVSDFLRKVKRTVNSKRTFSEEYNQYLKTKVSSEKGYMAFRDLFVLTKGKSNDTISSKINEALGKYDNLDSKGILNLSKAAISKTVATMKQNGFVEFDAVLPDAMIDAIYDYASKTPVSYLETATDDQKYSAEQVIFDENKPISPRYNFTGNEIVQCEALQELIFDQSLLAFAQEYLGCKPILDLVAFWWSAPFDGVGKNAAAQMYHFDLDRIKFMKFFFYITDVTPETGPHCFVKGSHGKLPKAINRDGRFEDSTIENIYGKENMMEICGKRGSILAVDTRGFHKGKDLSEGKRLLFQIQFTNSLFGQTYQPVDQSLILPKYKGLVDQYNHTYSNIC
ncbi:phytanoyl-CoA dioxygenase family protein [Flavobacterium sp.]|uniref:phytanoyl-CoA dioxygenase family protein n=1 Tax=Flavobacterium sp. TaxID=239 RepID=UPI00286BDCF4|nr:phytanoyl-CoA dioxygenase family protein [Flavobacterium sp.]